MAAGVPLDAEAQGEFVTGIARQFATEEVGAVQQQRHDARHLQARAEAEAEQRVLALEGHQIAVRHAGHDLKSEHVGELARHHQAAVEGEPVAALGEARDGVRRVLQALGGGEGTGADEGQGKGAPAGFLVQQAQLGHAVQVLA